MQDTLIYIIINFTSIIDHSDHGLTPPQAKLVTVESFPEGMMYRCTVDPQYHHTWLTVSGVHLEGVSPAQFSHQYITESFPTEGMVF